MAGEAGMELSTDFLLGAVAAVHGGIIGSISITVQASGSYSGCRDPWLSARKDPQHSSMRAAPARGALLTFTALGQAGWVSVQFGHSLEPPYP